jgi:serine/threonine protein kinase
LALVRKSGMVPEALLTSCLERLPANIRSASPTTLSETLIQQGILTQFQSQQLLLGKCRGFNIGKYKILERLGVGGMSLVYLCEEPEQQDRVAVKVLPNTHAQEAEYLKRFYREARAAAALDHPNIVRTYDIDHDGKVNFLVMEYIDGTLLFDLVQNFGPMDITRAAHYMRQSAIGLQHASQSNMVHRDIKPGNLILDRGGTVKILDMGLARIFNESEEVLTRGVLGTPDYLAPEQSLDSHNVDIRADIYSLGCTFYYLLTGGAPFAEGSLAQKLMWHQSRPPKPVRALRPEVPEGLAAIVHKMMAKKPEERQQTPAEVAQALEPYTQTPIRPPSEAEMPQLSPAAQSGRETATDLGTTKPTQSAPRKEAVASPAAKAGPGPASQGAQPLPREASPRPAAPAPAVGAKAPPVAPVASKRPAAPPVPAARPAPVVAKEAATGLATPAGKSSPAAKPQRPGVPQTARQPVPKAKPAVAVQDKEELLSRDELRKLRGVPKKRTWFDRIMLAIAVVSISLALAAILAALSMRYGWFR